MKRTGQAGTGAIALATLVLAASAAAAPPPAGHDAAAAAPRIEPWLPPGISSPRFESHPAFDPRTGDLYFVRSAPDFSGWRLFTSHCGEAGWSAPQPPSFAGDGVEADPWFSADGNTLWFISTRSTDGIRRKDLDLWRVTRNAKGQWGKPERLPAPLNSTGYEWFPRPAKDGWLYFGSDRPGGFGKTDIWRARQEPSGAWRVENAGAALNTAGDEYEALPSPDGSFLVLMTGDGLYRSEHARGAWQPRVRLPGALNANGSEVGALFSPSGRSMLFARDTKGKKSGELFVWRLQGDEDWPPACPRRETARGAGDGD